MTLKSKRHIQPAHTCTHSHQGMYLYKYPQKNPLLIFKNARCQEGEGKIKYHSTRVMFFNKYNDLIFFQLLIIDKILNPFYITWPELSIS